MNVITILKHVPDLVEEFELNESGTGLNLEWLKFILSEYDDHALEQSLLLKEQYGGSVRVIGLDVGELSESLFMAAAKGADELISIKGIRPEEIDSHLSARIFHEILSKQSFDLIITGVQAIDDRDGSVGPILAGYLDLPYVGVVRGISLSGDKKSAVVGKEYPGGIISEICITLPAVIGIQAAAKPPRYVPIAKIRQAQKTAKINEIDITDSLKAASEDVNRSVIKIRKMSKPEPTTKAKMLEGNTEEMAAQLAGIFAEKGIIR